MRVLLALIFLLTVSTAYAGDIYVVRIDGVISSFTSKYIEESLEKAQAEDGVLVMKLDTPGGLLSATRDIVSTLLESKTLTVTHVSPQGSRAGSAGSFITLASHYAVMAEGSNIGAAHPVNITGEDIKGDMREKIENDTIAFMRSIAEKRGRNPDIAIQMVKNSLSLTSMEALEANVIDAVLNTDDELAGKLKEEFGVTGNVVYLEPTTLQKAAFFLSDPNILLILLFIGILAIVLEFKMPGTFVFAAVGICAIVMFLMGINIIPVNWLGVILLLGGVGLMAAEVFIPSFGLLTLSSIVSIGFGMYLMFDREGNMGVQVSWVTIVGVLTVFTTLALVLGRLIVKDFLRKPATGLESIVGKQGRIMSWENGEGKIYVHGEIWTAESKDGFEKDDTAEVVSIEGMRLGVRKV
ncbi:NfeD family protein [Limisalsivibrio acetivorans]|uniref:NfeD family protein n=1 Tax=Limisalsivibrio acetivorans TaxID=1304888 RepID=UPI0003B4BD15|nr:nodulation protein NfeD [Limisalsivibrio acetivorans]